MKYKAILFGSIGTLIESSNIQRNSFNEAFKEAGLDWYWDEQDYKILLKKSGGTKRVEDFAEKNNTNVNASQIRNRKTEIFSSFIIKNKQKLRKSVDEILKYTKDNNIKLAFSTSTTLNNVDAVFESLSGQISKEEFEFIGNKSFVKNEKPHPEIYKVTLDKLNLQNNFKKPNFCDIFGSILYDKDLFKIDFLVNQSKNSKKPGISSFFTWLDQYI